MRAYRILFCVLGLGFAVSARAAEPVARMSWDQCDPIVSNKNFSGPGSYTIIISETGATGSFFGDDISLLLTPQSGAAYPDAWRFDTDVAACQTGRMTTAKAPALAECPIFLGPLPLKIDYFAFDPSTNSGFLRVAEVYDPFTPDPAVRHLVRRLIFDHSQSVVGDGDAGAGTCGHAETAMCISFLNVSLFDTGNVEHLATFENSGVTWQDGSGFGGPCGPVPTVPTTWGKMKGMYR